MNHTKQPAVATATSAGLRHFADKLNFSLGTAIAVEHLISQRHYQEVIASEFNTCVAENHFKPAYIWQGPDLYDFDDADALVSFSSEHQLALRGHTLLWHQSAPTWIVDGGYSSKEIASLLRDYIHTVVGRYRGRISSWDVVNEAIDEDDDCRLRATFWLNALGPEYISKAFHWAKEADPEVTLYYNDYDAESIGPKSDAVYRLVSDLLATGTPVDGVGLQCHFHNGWRLDRAMTDNVDRIERLGLEWTVTECDVRIHLDGKLPTADELALQADAYADLLEFCLDRPACKGMLLWGVSDAYSWIPGFRKGWGSALVLDENFAPKPAYAALERLLRARATDADKQHGHQAR